MAEGTGLMDAAQWGRGTPRCAGMRKQGNQGVCAVRCRAPARGAWARERVHACQEVGAHAYRAASGSLTKTTGVLPNHTCMTCTPAAQGSATSTSIHVHAQMCSGSLLHAEGRMECADDALLR